ncbi:MAG: adenylate/guanylate cyclase domain-containing protein [Burkholderiales bacterium]|nr:adenylate/guanylate cyclase domain-containing protein [Burkholderiales bacterium]MDP2399582.1 adenylate/guanylate cyclase domain-containing protein [Burkholderiales bacterium]
MRKNLTRIVIGMVIVAMFLAHAVHVLRIPFLENLESIVYDTRLRLTMPNTVDPRVVILDIDEKSLQEKEQGGEGRWPWPRDRLALLLDKLFDKYGIAVVGFDVVFAERDESSGIRVLERLGQRELKGVPQFQSALEQVRPQLEYDDIFASKMKGRTVVLGHVFLSDDPASASTKGMLPPPVLPAGAFGGRRVGVTSWNGYTANLERLQRAATSAGHINPLPDPDGITRRVPMLVEHAGAYYEPLSLAMVRAVTGQPPVVPVVSADASSDYSGLEWVKAGPFEVPVDIQAAALVPYRGGKGSYRYYSLVDVLNERVPVDELKGKIALVGTTAPGLLDLRATPVDPVFPGVEIHANLVGGILDGNIKQRPPYVVGAEFVLLLLSGAALALLLPLLTPFRSMLVTALVLLSVIGTNLVVFHSGNLVLPLASGILLILVLFTFNMAYGFLVEARGTRLITGLFGQYVPPELVEEMARNPEQFNMAPRAEELSVLFSDVRGFTTISESLSPEDLSVYINDYLTTMSLVIREGHRGTLDKYIGDAIMAFWGAPMPDPNHAQNAVLAALDMMKQAKVLNEKFHARNWPPFAIGIGVNSGIMRVGDMGSKIRKAYTVMGDAVNLGSRLEGITKQYGAGILIGQETKERISGVVLREIDMVQVKGKDEPITIYEPLGLEGEVEQNMLDEIKLWQQALRYYRAQDWDKAELQLLNLKKTAVKTYLYDVFIERIATYRAHPPEAEWKGVHKFETK